MSRQPSVPSGQGSVYCSSIAIMSIVGLLDFQVVTDAISGSVRIVCTVLKFTPSDAI